jgi:hypothetical protein
MQILNTASKDRFALGCLATMTVWFCQDLIFGDKIPFFRDLASYFYPIKFSVADAFKTGQLPLWDTHMAGGFPILAEFQSAVFYPPTVLYYLLPFFSAIQASYVFHFSIAAAGSYVLLRSWKYPCHVCTLGAMLFAFGGTTVSLSNLLNHFQSAVWLPWVIYCWERAVETKRRPAVVVFSVISLCQLLAGSPEIFANGHNSHFRQQGVSHLMVERRSVRSSRFTHYGTGYGSTAADSGIGSPIPSRSSHSNFRSSLVVVAAVEFNRPCSSDG